MEELGRNKRARRAYGFDEVALVPGRVTINPAEIDVTFALNGHTLPIPFLAAAMDGVVDVPFAQEMGRLGGLGVLNLDGVQTRYEDPRGVLREIADTPPERINTLLQKLYSAPVQDGLIGQRVEEIKSAGVACAVSTAPQHAERRGSIVQEAGADVLVVQGTVLTARHISQSYRHLSFRELCDSLDIPVIAGNCVDYATALELMDTGIKGLLVGVGPGAACTTRAVLGVGVPQVTATVDCAAARDDHLRRSGERVAIITDGGMRLGGDVCKAFASGADAVMIGSVFAAAEEAAGHGNHWGMATPDPNLPRGTRIRTGVKAPLREMLFGPAHVDDGSMNLVGALKNAMGVCGARNVKEFQETEMVIAPSIKTEGKMQQRDQKVGMGA
ncbi:MAG: GuaB3 family IMP dehydrogenase-related protein [Candidatus Dormibacteria bacterium]